MPSPKIVSPTGTTIGRAELMPVIMPSNEFALMMFDHVRVTGSEAERRIPFNASNIIFPPFLKELFKKFYYNKEHKKNKYREANKVQKIEVCQYSVYALIII